MQYYFLAKNLGFFNIYFLAQNLAFFVQIWLFWQKIDTENILPKLSDAILQYVYCIKQKTTFSLSWSNTENILLNNQKNRNDIIKIPNMKKFIAEKKPTAPSVPRRSPIQVLTRLNVA